MDGGFTPRRVETVVPIAADDFDLRVLVRDFGVLVGRAARRVLREDVVIDVASAKRVKDRTGVDLLKALDPEAGVLDQLAAEALLIYDVILALVNPPCDIGEVMDEETLSAAGQALIDAVLDFFHPAKAAPVRRLVERAKQAIRRRQAGAAEQLAEAAEQYDVGAAIEQFLTAGGSATGSPASSASTPTPAASAS